MIPKLAQRLVPKTTDEWIGTSFFLVAVAVGAFLRFHALALKPLHSDEGVNGWFLMNLYKGLHRSGHWQMNYRYDPTNYHGPFLYFAGLIPFFLLGPTVATLRLLPAIAGTACMLTLWPIRKYLGWAGLVTATFLMAVSPPFVFFSRTAIHEIYVFYFSLLAFVCFVRCYAGAGEDGQPRFRRDWLLFGFISCALLFTNKETSIITFAAFLLAGGVAWFGSVQGGPMRRRLKRLMGLAPQGKDEWNDYGLSVAWAAAIIVILFTSFFNNPRGAWDMFATYGTWIGRGNEGAGHNKPFGYWVELLREFDAPILWLALLGTAAALWRRDRFSLFVVVWAWWLWLVYSKISYKTPWCNLNFTGPACLLGGIAVREVVLRLKDVNPSPWVGRIAIAIAGPLIILWPVPAGAVLGSEKPASKIVTWWKLDWDVNFVHYDDDRYKIIYVQTVHDFETMIGKLDALYAKHGDKLSVWVTSGDYWPMPFYERNHDTEIAYHQGKIPSGSMPNVVIASSTQEAELRGRLEGYRVEHYMLRPGVVLTMYVEPAIWDPVFGPPKDEALPPEVPSDTSALVPGLVAEYRYGIGCTGEVLARRADPEPRYGGNEEEREFRAPVCVTWKGFLKVDADDEYAFLSRSDDGSWVWLDGQLALDNGGTHGPIPRDGVLHPMKAGLHPIEVRYFDAGGGALLEVKIHKRGGPEESLAGKVVYDPHDLRVKQLAGG